MEKIFLISISILLVLGGCGLTTNQFVAQSCAKADEINCNLQNKCLSVYKGESFSKCETINGQEFEILNKRIKSCVSANNKVWSMYKNECVDKPINVWMMEGIKGDGLAGCAYVVEDFENCSFLNKAQCRCAKKCKIVSLDGLDCGYIVGDVCGSFSCVEKNESDIRKMNDYYVNKEKCQKSSGQWTDSDNYSGICNCRFSEDKNPQDYICR